MKRSLFAIVCCLAVSLCVQAEVKLAPIIADGMVLQRDRDTPIWGRANPGEKITVEFNGKNHSATAGADGAWRVTLDAMPAGGPHTMTVSGSNRITVKDILIGEVWICGGQSNMEWPLRSTDGGESAIASSADSMLRLFRIEHATADSPQSECIASWAAASPESTRDFSGVAFHFGKILRKELNVPVGLVQPTWGGTPAEAWMSDEALRQGDRFAGMFKRFELWKQTAPVDQREYEQKLAAWEEAAKKAKQAGEKAPRKPAEPKSLREQLYPSKLYNAMIVPIAPFAARGVIWYQGEANADRAHQYRTLLPALIADWRRAWENDSMPFGIVQLASYGPAYHGPVEPTVWAELRDAQLQTVKNVPNTGLAVAIDIGQVDNIHPKNKAEVGRRLSLWALARVYDRSMPYSGPIYKSHRIEGDKIYIQFDHADSGLQASNGGELTGFAIAGDDRIFVKANAAIIGDGIVISSMQVKKPASVRYAWVKWPQCNLVNGAGLPASPFKTDDWPDKTEGEN